MGVFYIYLHFFKKYLAKYLQGIKKRCIFAISKNKEGLAELINYSSSNFYTQWQIQLK